MTDRVARADEIRTDQNVPANWQWIAMEAALLPVLANVVRPPFFARRNIEGVERPRTRADEDLVADDRRRRVDSAAGLELPDDLRSGWLRQDDRSERGGDCNNQGGKVARHS